MKVKVNINVTSLENKKKKKKGKKKAQNNSPPIPKEKKVSQELLDTLFSFLGVSSNKDTIETTQTDRLNLYTSRTHASRSTAGTIDLMPGNTNAIFERPR